MMRLHVLALAGVMALSAGCAERSWSLYPPAEFGPRPYNALDHARDTARSGTSRPVFALTVPSPRTAAPKRSRPADPPVLAALESPAARPAPTAPRVRPPAPTNDPPSADPPAADPPSLSADLGALPAPIAAPHDAEQFACLDGSVLDVRYSEDGKSASARWGDGAAVDLRRDDSQPLLTYSNGSATLRRAGPRAAWESGAAAGQVTVRPGDTLSKIALAHYGSYAQVDAIVRANAGAISDPNLIFPGQVLVLPGTESGGGQTSCRRTMTAERI